MRIQAKKLVLALLAVVLASDVALAEVEAPEWVDFYGNISINGNLAAAGSVVEAFDPDGVNCGVYTVETSGSYGFLHVYRDDNTTPGVDEGALPGDSITLRINGMTATRTVVSGGLVWTSNGDQNNVDISIAGALISFTIVDRPTTKAGNFGDTVRFEVGVRNDGNILDGFRVASMDDTSASNAWTTIDQDTLSYADPNDTVYVYFDAVLPIFGGGLDTVYTIYYTVYSNTDSTVQQTDSVTLIKSVTDVGDNPWSALPGHFNLFQNYPNPFNPTTMIAFDLPRNSSVSLEIINILGQVVDVRALGEFSAGFHEIEYDASGLGSGVYFYRLSSEFESVTRKMMLLK